MKNKIIYDGKTFGVTEINSGQIHLAASLPAMKLEPNTFTVVVKSGQDLTKFTRNTPLYYYHREKLVCISYVQTVDRIGPNKYKFYGTSAIGRLMEQPHAGGIYTGQTAEEVITDICGPVPFEIKNNLKKIKLYGWLPYANPPKRSARDNLSQVLFAIGATIKTDLNGVLRIEGLWDGIAGAVDRPNMYKGASATHESAVTEVIITEHQYIPWTEEQKLFEGTAQAGDVITFDAPMHSLKAQGFSIQASGANWARVSAGSGTLTGKTYIHNTRQVSKSVQTANTPNVKTVEDATLVSLTNSTAVANRLADYYRCRERIEASVVYQGESPGDRLAVYHPFEKTGVAACLESADITLSNTLKAEETLLVGYIPPQMEDVEYFDYSEVITQDKDWTAPEDVTVVTAVCIGGGWGGSSGYRGKDMPYPPPSLNLSTGNQTWEGYDAGYGAEGGAGGTPGSGGRIVQGNINVTPGQVIHAHIGLGGKGGARASGTTSNAGAEGGATTFGALSSASGSPNSAGYTDIFTGQVYARPGQLSGISGGKGAGKDPNSSSGYIDGTIVRDRNGVIWRPGAKATSSDIVFADPGGDDYAGQAGKGCGGGPAVGANGADGRKGSAYYSGSASVTGGAGGSGGTPEKPAKQTRRGFGGDGGHGGGGAGGSGLAAINTKYRGYYTVNRGSPGYGGEGADGGDGIIILYYSRPKRAPAGQLVDKNNRMVLDRLGRRIIV